MKVPIELPEVPGFEYTGEYRKAKADEWISINGEPFENENPHNGECYFILKKKPPEYITNRVYIKRKDESFKMVSINALADALGLVAFELNETEDYKALKALL